MQQTDGPFDFTDEPDKPCGHEEFVEGCIFCQPNCDKCPPDQPYCPHEEMPTMEEFLAEQEKYEVEQRAENAKERIVEYRYYCSYNHETDQEPWYRDYGIHPPCGKKQGDSPPCDVDGSPKIDKIKVNDVVTHFMGAPGAGKVAYHITKIDEEGAWGYVLEDTSYIMDVGDVI